MAELKPCPFCGNRDLSSGITMTFGSTSRGYVMCTNCSARIERSFQRKAIEAWNRRTSESIDEEKMELFRE